MNNEKKTPVELLKEQLTNIVTTRERCHDLRRQARYLARLPHQAEKLDAKIEKAKAAEAEAVDAIDNAEDKAKAEAVANAAKARVDTLERTIQSVQTKVAGAEAKIKELEAMRTKLRTAAAFAAAAATEAFHRLVGMGKIGKKNSRELMPLVRQCGLPLGSISKRRWAR